MSRACAIPQRNAETAPQLCPSHPLSPRRRPPLTLAPRHKAMRPPTGAKHPQQWGHGHASSQLVCAPTCETAPYGYKFGCEPPPKAQGSPSTSPSHLWLLSTAYAEPATINPGRVFLGCDCCRQSPYSGCPLPGVYAQCHEVVPPLLHVQEQHGPKCVPAL